MQTSSMQTFLNLFKEFNHRELPEYGGYFYEMFQVPSKYHENYKIKVYDKKGSLVKEWGAGRMFNPERIHQLIDWEILHIWPNLLTDEVPETPDEFNT